MGAFPFARTPAESGVEKPRVMNTKFTHRRIKGYHLSGRIGRDADFFLRSENIKLSRTENDRFPCTPIERFPKFSRIIVSYLGKINGGSLPFSLVSDYVGAINTN